MLNRWNFLKTGFYEGINLGHIASHSATRSSDGKPARTSALNKKADTRCFVNPTLSDGLVVNALVPPFPRYHLVFSWALSGLYSTLPGILPGNSMPATLTLISLATRPHNWSSRSESASRTLSTIVGML